MPHSADPVRRNIGVTVSLVVTLLLSGLLLLIWSARTQGERRPVDLVHILQSAGLQASLTTIVSLVVGVALAWALNRLRFPGRAMLVSLLSAALVMPGLVVAVGLLSIWGRAGWLNLALSPFGLHAPSIYGLGGIIYAHAALDATFAAAVLLPRLDGLPRTRLRLGQSLRLSPLKRFLVIDWPVLAPALPGLGAIIFLLAFTSFPIVLVLGGGPANQTLEVAIYAAVRLDFDLGGAVRLALVQLAISAALILPATAFAPVPPGTGAKSSMLWQQPGGTKRLAAMIIITAVLAFGLPLLAVLAGLTGIAELVTEPAFWLATITSFAIGAASATLALVLGLTLAMARVSARNKATATLIAAPAMAYLAMPGVTLALGFFLGARALGVAPYATAPLVLIIANALMTLPYAIATLTPALQTIQTRYAKLVASLPMTGPTRWTQVEWPLLGREIGLVLAMGFCFSLGDLSVIALFGTENFSTLPWLMHRALGAYRSTDAAAIGAILLIVSILTFLALPPLLEKLSHARA